MIQVKEIIEKYCVDFLFPKECLACKKEGVNLCSLCQKALHRLTEQLCPTCFKDTQGRTCLSCSKKSSLKASLALLDYSDPQVRKLCNALKHEGLTDIASAFSADLVELLNSHKITLDYIVPVPLSQERRRERGYNQAELIAHSIGRQLNIPVRLDILQRQIHTKPQQNLKKAQRLKNLTNAFSTFRKLQPTTILLIDDVSTSGSTLTVCANTLVKAGAKEIYGLTLARGKLT